MITEAMEAGGDASQFSMEDKSASMALQSNNDEIENIIDEISAAQSFGSSEPSVSDAAASIDVTNGAEIMDSTRSYAMAPGDLLTPGEDLGEGTCQTATSDFSTPADAGIALSEPSTSQVGQSDVMDLGDEDDDLGIELPLFTFRPLSVGQVIDRNLISLIDIYFFNLFRIMFLGDFFEFR